MGSRREIVKKQNQREWGKDRGESIIPTMAMRIQSISERGLVWEMNEGEKTKKRRDRERGREVRSRGEEGDSEERWRERSREFWENGSKMGPTFKEIQLAMGCWASTLYHTIPSQWPVCPYWTLPLFLILFFATSTFIYQLLLDLNKF